MKFLFRDSIIDENKIQLYVIQCRFNDSMFSIIFPTIKNVWSKLLKTHHAQ